MPVSKKKPIISTSECSTQQSASPTLPEQDEFRQHLRHLAVSAVQVLIEQGMREELEQYILEPTFGRSHSRASWLSQWLLHPRFGHRLDVLKTFRSPEIGKECFTAKCSSVTVGMNQRWPKRSPCLYPTLNLPTSMSHP